MMKDQNQLSEKQLLLRLLFEAEIELRRKDSVELADKIRETLAWLPMHEKMNSIQGEE